MRVSRTVFFIIATLMLISSITGLVYAEESSVLKNFSKTTTTETYNLTTDGDIIGRTVVTETKVAMKVKTTDVYNVDSNGIEYVSRRTTETSDGSGVIDTTVEEPIDAGDELIVVSVTTISRNGSTVTTTYQGLDSETGDLVINKRVTRGIDEEGRNYVAVEQRDDSGKLKIIKTTITSSD